MILLVNSSGGGLVAQLCPTLCDPMDCSPPGSSVHGILQARILEWKKKKKNTGVGSHFLLQGIFFTQESNLGLLHCRQILQTFKEEITTVLPDLFQKVEKEGTLSRSTLSKQN